MNAIKQLIKTPQGAIIAALIIILLYLVGGTALVDVFDLFGVDVATTQVAE